MRPLFPGRWTCWCNMPAFAAAQTTKCRAYVRPRQMASCRSAGRLWCSTPTTNNPRLICSLQARASSSDILCHAAESQPARKEAGGQSAQARCETAPTQPVDTSGQLLDKGDPCSSCQLSWYMRCNSHAQCRSETLQAVRTATNSWIFWQVPHGWCLHLEGTAWSACGATRWQSAALAV